MKRNSFLLVITLSLNLLILAASWLSVDFSEWYSVTVYPFFRFVFSKIFGIFPFSAAEILLAALIIAVIAGIVVFIIRIIKSKGARKTVFLKTLLFTLNAASVALLVFLLNCGINYNRRPFSETNKGVDDYSEEELTYVFEKMLGELEEITPLINTNGGAFVLTSELGKDAPAALVNLSEKYPRLGKTFAAPKPVLTSVIMSKTLIEGVYSPFTVEANYNKDIPDSEKPFAVCHELAHLSGFMKEEEANFISFLACRESGNPEFMYSAYLYALDGLSGYVPWGYDMLPEQAKTELDLQYEYWRGFMFDSKSVVNEDSGEVIEVMVPSPLMEISEDINDAYLKINGQEDGVESYSRMIDLLVSDYLNKR